ncbi:hypothetical protein [Streptomyces sp. NPDC051561]|uniref:hypothetical protein n=1 Tax=Streptomyces sp. NPDC051561 TaxID=3365658 RepID=UPI0037BBC56D
MENHQPPDGWTIQQIRDVSGDGQAQALSPDRPAVYFDAPDKVLHPTFVLGFGDLCIMKAAGSDYWYMGSLNDDGSVLCWSVYDEPHEALLGL